jgi:hypothetical protein
VNGFFGSYQVFGSFSGPVNSNPTVSNIIASGAGSSGYVYDFTGPLNGNGYTLTSQIPPTPCVILGCIPAPVGTAGLHVAPDYFNNSAALSLEDTGELFTGSGSLSCSTTVSNTPPPPPSCGPFNVVTSGNGTPNIYARYTPDGSMSLEGAAAACNYIGFNWQQQINLLPCPSAFLSSPPPETNPPTTDPNAGNTCQANGTDAAHLQTPNGLTAPPSFSDPPPFGYQSLSGYNPYPFYYPSQPNALVPNQPLVLSDGNDHNPLDPQNPGSHLPGVNNSGMFLAMSDAPADPCLPGGTLNPIAAAKQYLQRVALCGWDPVQGGLLAPNGSAVGFSTSLVGLIDENTASAPLYVFTWVSTFNRTAGGVAGLSNAGPADADSGTGYVTITSINGVPVPPIVPQSAIAVTASGLAYSRVSQTFNGTVKITNISSTTFYTPTNFQLVLTALHSGVILANSAGTFNQSPYITVPLVTSLMPNQSVSVAVQFKNPSGATMNFTPEFYAGSFQ